MAALLVLYLPAPGLTMQLAPALLCPCSGQPCLFFAGTCLLFAGTTIRLSSMLLLTASVVHLCCHASLPNCTQTHAILLECYNPTDDSWRHVELPANANPRRSFLAACGLE
jgi:hypothetical protein